MSKKAILFSIKPQYVSLIASGQKEYELRRQKPNISSGDLAMVYESSPTKSLVGAFFVGEILSMPLDELWNTVSESAGISKQGFYNYFEGCKQGCAIGIKQYWGLSERVCIKKMRKHVKVEPPQSYRFLTKEQIGDIMSIADKDGNTSDLEVTTNNLR